MFGLGMPEILMILAIALIVIGPKKLPDLAKTLGRAMGEFKRSAQDFKRSIDAETTIQEFKKDIEIPKVDLNQILTDPPAEDETSAPDKDKKKAPVTDKDNSRPGNQDQKNADHTNNNSSENNDSFTFKDLGKADNTSEHDKI